VPSGLTFTHAHGRAYGTPPAATNNQVIDEQVIDDAVSGLRNLEFTAAQARGAVAAVASHAGPNASVEQLIVAALRQMHRERSGRSATGR
jgi:Holliday junction resolvasome RuvABC DNA-binding subunit